MMTQPIKRLVGKPNKQLASFEKHEIIKEKEIKAQIDDHDSDLNIRIRVVKMTVMWTTCSFASHLLNIMNKYLEGTIFTNMYIEGIAGGIGLMMAVKLYN